MTVRTKPFVEGISQALVICYFGLKDADQEFIVASLGANVQQVVAVAVGAIQGQKKRGVIPVVA